MSGRGRERGAGRRVDSLENEISLLRSSGAHLYARARVCAYNACVTVSLGSHSKPLRRTIDFLDTRRFRFARCPTTRQKRRNMGQTCISLAEVRTLSLRRARPFARLCARLEQLTARPNRPDIAERRAIPLTARKSFPWFGYRRQLIVYTARDQLRIASARL